MGNEILKFCVEKGLLLDNEVLNLLNEVNDVESVKLMIEKIRKHTNKIILTKEVFNSNKDKVDEFLSELPKTKKESLEKLKIKLGLSIEISKKVKRVELIEDNSDILKNQTDMKMPGIVKNTSKKEKNQDIKISSMIQSIGKKIEVGDFISYFRNRFTVMKNVLQEHPQLDNLVSLNKLSGNNGRVSVIGMVSNKRVTKNKNILLEIEDLTGKLKVLINKNKEELYKKAEDIVLDSVIGFRGTGSREILFVNDIIFPDSRLLQRKKAPEEEYALFIGDLHYGSKKFMKENFLRFIDYLNGKVQNGYENNKIKYLFIVGDLITGIGNYPNQEKDLEIDDLEKQFEGIAGLLKKIRKDIEIIICPGNHEGLRLMEPQPLFDEKYAWPLYELENVFLTGNPSQINIASKENFSGFDVLMYHGFSFPYYANTIPKLVTNRAMNSPEKILSFLLMYRHLAPTHGSVQYFPLNEDAHFIKKIPDIFVAGHVHKSAVSYYNNILLISTSSWEEMTSYQEKFGNMPDHCKVPMLNLKTRAIKILDFE